MKIRDIVWRRVYLKTWGHGNTQCHIDIRGKSQPCWDQVHGRVASLMFNALMVEINA